MDVETQLEIKQKHGLFGRWLKTETHSLGRVGLDAAAIFAQTVVTACGLSLILHLLYFTTSTM
jgi:hypothetical protein